MQKRRHECVERSPEYILTYIGLTANRRAGTASQRVQIDLNYAGWRPISRPERASQRE